MTNASWLKLEDGTYGLFVEKNQRQKSELVAICRHQVQRGLRPGWVATAYMLHSSTSEMSHIHLGYCEQISEAMAIVEAHTRLSAQRPQ